MERLQLKFSPRYGLILRCPALIGGGVDRDPAITATLSQQPLQMINFSGNSNACSRRVSC